MVRAEIAAPPTDPERVKDWLCRLIDAIGMKLAVGPAANPIAYYCDTPGNRGLTASAIIETSNITLHTWDEASPGELQLDLFTCGHLEVDAALRFLDEFAPKRVEHLVIDRLDGLTIALVAPTAADVRDVIVRARRL
jgi:S-adenosylmethionine/arginine decarboxylase-like enzyme